MWDSLTRYLPEDWGDNVLELWAGTSETFCELKTGIVIVLASSFAHLDK